MGSNNTTPIAAAKGLAIEAGRRSANKAYARPHFGPRGGYAFGPENAPSVRLPGPSHYASMGQGITSFAFHALDPMRKRSGRPGRQNIGRKEVKTVFDPDQGKSFLEWVLILLRLFREIRELGPKKEKTPLPPKSSHRKKR